MQRMHCIAILWVTYTGAATADCAQTNVDNGGHRGREKNDRGERLGRTRSTLSVRPNCPSLSAVLES